MRPVRHPMREQRGTMSRLWRDTGRSRRCQERQESSQSSKPQAVPAGSGFPHVGKGVGRVIPSQDSLGRTRGSKTRARIEPCPEMAA